MTRSWIYISVIFFAACFRDRQPIEDQDTLIAIGVIIGSGVSLFLHWIIDESRK